MSIMQPTYFPWAGYFNLISQVDVFIFLDDVQFEKCSWQNRNRILAEGKPLWITVPSIRRSLSERISEIQIDDRNRWREKHIKTLTQAYSKSPFKNEMLEMAGGVLDENFRALAELNIRIIQNIAEKLDCAPKFVRASAITVEGTRSERLLNMCRKFSCDEYLSPVGSRDYLEEDGVFSNSSTKLLFQDYTPGTYTQCKQPVFVSHLSILDVIANLGLQQAKSYIRTGNDCCNS